MPEERDFLQQRFALVNRHLESEDSLERVARIQLQRERRLLGKMLAELPEGRVLETLQAWREMFNREWGAHRKQRRKLLADDSLRAKGNKEALSSGAVVTDKNEQKWVVDGRYMQMMDDLIARLKKFMEERDDGW